MKGNVACGILLTVVLLLFSGCEKLVDYGEGRYLCEEGALVYLECVEGFYIRWANNITTEQQNTVRNIVKNMVRIEGGTFVMGSQHTNPNGSNYNAEANEDEMPVHNVTLSDYYLGKFEVTQHDWESIMGNRADWSNVYGMGRKHPAYNIRYVDALLFISNMNELTGLNFRLPTEAEWEYAARGGNQSHGFSYSGSNDIHLVAWYKDNSNYTSHEIGTKQPNELGLYDMSGNVCEWCSDYYGLYSGENQTNPSGAEFNDERVVRGGSFCYLGYHCKCTARDHFNETGRSIGVGFRLVITQ